MRRWSLPWTRPTLSPAIDAVLALNLDQLDDPNEIRRVFSRGLLNSLIRETEWATKRFPYISAYTPSLKRGELNVVLDIASTPFGRYSRESEHASCREASVRELATSVGLYADRLILSDEFSNWFSDDRPIPWEAFAADLRALRVLRPLILDGTIGFANSSPRICENCFGEYIEDARTASLATVEELAPYFTVAIGADSKTVTIDLDYPEDNLRSIVFKAHDPVPTSRLREFALDMLAENLTNYAHHDYVTRMIAREQSAMLLSSHSLSVLQFRSQFEKSASLAMLAEWERQHSVVLPWISHLDVNEVSRLRREAPEALQNLREQLSVWTTPLQAADFDERILELKESVVQLDIELKALNRRGEQWFGNVSGGLAAFGLSLGFAAGAVPAPTALLGLFAMLGVVHNFERQDSQEEAKLQARPAYAFLRAKRMFDQHMRQ